jgi:gas vesicle protein
MSDDRNGFLGVVFTFLTGAAIGAGLALLYAPHTGEETRKKIKDVKDKVSDDVRDSYDKFSKEAQTAIDAVKNSSEKAVKQIKTFIDQAKESLAAENLSQQKPVKKTPAKKA